MRRLARLTMVIALLVLVLTGVALRVNAASPQHGTPPGQEKERIENQQQFLAQHKDKAGKVRPDLWRKGVDDAKRMKIAAGMPRALGGSAPRMASAPGVALSSGVVGVQWTQIGPAPLRIDKEQNFQGSGPDSGEVVDIAIDPRNASDQTIYIAVNDGGIWKSTDGGTSWKAKTDYMPSLSMGAVALDPINPSIVYAGTGNPFDGANLFTKGVGIYRSIDGGETWSTLGTNIFTNRVINRIVLPAANVLLVASNNGLYRSVDGGQTFGSNSPLFNDGQPLLASGQFVSDLALDPSSANTVYAAVAGQGIFRSTDGGVTFPTNLFSNPGAPAGSYGNITFSQSVQPNNQTLYASVQGAPYAGLFKSTDAGGAWAKQNVADAEGAADGGCQCGYDLTVGVDPQDANRVYIGFQQLYLSTDGGGSFGGAITANQVHFDHHALRFSPSAHWGGGGAPTRIYVGTDGGIATSGNGGSNWSNIDEGIATNLFRAIDIGRGSSANNAYTYGGTQDTGTIERRPGFAGNDWHLGIDGDGGRVAVDPSNPQRAYGADDGGYKITTDAGDNWSTPGGTGLPLVFALAIDPNSSSVVYASSATNFGFTPGNQLFQSTDTGATFTSIKTFPSTIQVLATTKLDSNRLWVGLTNGTVQYTTNATSGASATWTALSIPGASGSVGGIAIDPTNTDQVVVVYNGFTGINPSNRTRHVFRTADNGANWTDISGTDGGDPTQNLPDLPLHSIVIDPGTTPHMIVVASDAGVMRTADGGATWQALGVGLPTVYGSSLAIDTSVTPSLLRLGTYGRSVFELTSATGPLLAVNADLAFGVVARGTSASRIMQLFNVGSSDLHISSIIRVAGSTDFQIVSGPATPTTIAPGEELDYTVQFTPTGTGDKTATFQINSDDPFQPARQVFASGTVGVPHITLASSQLSFGNVAVDDRTTPNSSDQVVRITNQASCALCDLTLTSLPITGSNASDFSVVSPPSLPTKIGAGNHLDLTVRFNPSAAGARTATLTVNSDDPVNPSLAVSLSGVGLVPFIDPTPTPLIFGPTVYDPVCGASCGQTLPETISNTGQTELILDTLSVTSGGSSFSAPGATSPLTRVQPGHSFNENVTFHPTTGPARKVTGTLHVEDTLGGAGSVSADVPLCGESVGRGIRVLVYDTNGSLVATVDRLALKSHGLTNPINIQQKNLTLTTIDPPTSCQRIQFHYENQNLPAAGATVQQGSYYDLTVTVGSKHASQTFTLGVNEFKTIVVTVQP
jgi:photosystem II stability/assembly factor-like uncharacterized protein